MLEYRRLHESEVQRTNELEAQRRVLEASVQAVEVCWTQVSFILKVTQICRSFVLARQWRERSSW